MTEPRVFLKNLASSQEFPVVGEVVAGRDEKCGLRLATTDKNKPSHRHARLREAAGELSVEDLGSTNGTFVNGAQLAKGQVKQLKNGDRLSFHWDVYEVRIDADKTVFVPLESAPAPTVLAPAPPRSPAPGATPPSARVDGQNEPDWIREKARSGGTVFVDRAQIERAVARANEVRELAKLDAGLNEPHLTLIENGRPGRQFPLRAVDGKTEWTIGREAPNDIVLDFPSVSVRHARIVLHAGKWRIEDQITSNGTWVDGSQANLRYIGPLSVLGFGNVECLFRLPQGGSRWKRSSGPSVEADSRWRWLVSAGIACVVVLIAWVLYRVILD
jgi:pSer/pThr/pTyr-binding forkhead associated (FHA) protein